MFICVSILIYYGHINQTLSCQRASSAGGAYLPEYRRRHSRGAIWPEILAGIREVGILEMEIYLLDTRLFMIVEVPVGFDWNAAMERLATLPRQQEWEDYMAIFQLVKPGSTAAEKWQPMERIFHLYD